MDNFPVMSEFIMSTNKSCLHKMFSQGWTYKLRPLIPDPYVRHTDFSGTSSRNVALITLNAFRLKMNENGVATSGK